MKKEKRWSVRVHPACVALFVLALLFAPSRQVIAALLALVWHELSHVMVMLCLGVRRCTVELTPFGGMADAQGFEKLSPCRQALCALAGVAGSGVGAWSCAALLPHTEFGYVLFQNHLSLALANCLPAWPLDGARMLIAIAACFGKESGMRRLLSAAATVLGCALASLGLYGAWQGQINLSLLLSGPYLCYAAREGLVADRIRQVHSAAQKLGNAQLLPVRILASAEPDIRAHFPVLLGRWPQNQYHMLYELDSKGCVKRMWTESEIWQHTLESIGDSEK